MSWVIDSGVSGVAAKALASIEKTRSSASGSMSGKSLAVAAFTSSGRSRKAADRLSKTAPAGSEVGIAAIKSGIAAVNSAYENLSKVAKQYTEATQTNFETVAKQAVNGAKKAKKAA